MTIITPTDTRHALALRTHALLRDTVYAQNDAGIEAVRSGQIAGDSAEFRDFLAIHLQAHFLLSLETEYLVQEDHGIDLYFACALGGLGLDNSLNVFRILGLKLELITAHDFLGSTSVRYDMARRNLAAQVCLTGSLLDIPSPEIVDIFEKYYPEASTPEFKQSLRSALAAYSPGICFGYIEPNAFRPEHQELLLDHEARLRDYHRTALAYADVL